MQLFYGPNASPGPNGSNYSNKRFDELYDKSMKMPSGDARTRVYKQMRDIVVDDSPWIFGVHRLGYRVYHGWVHNLKMHVMVQDYAKYIKIDAKTRAEKKSSL